MDVIPTLLQQDVNLGRWSSEFRVEGRPGPQCSCLNNHLNRVLVVTIAYIYIQARRNLYNQSLGHRSQPTQTEALLLGGQTQTQLTTLETLSLSPQPPETLVPNLKAYS